MLRFYGIKSDELWALPFSKFDGLWEMVTVLDAEQMLNDLRISRDPHTKKKSQTSFWQSLMKKAFPEWLTKSKQKVWHLDDIAKILGM